MQVMQDSLPDLFDAQPDLLFQLVTMLNPSVLLAKRVPVYSIIQVWHNLVYLEIHVFLSFARFTN